MPEKFTPELYDKIWIAHDDERTRPSHAAADGQRTPFSGTFTVGGVQLRYPGDPDGPPDEVKNCRCHLRIVQRVAALANEQEIEMAPKAANTVTAAVGDVLEDGSVIVAEGHFDETGKPVITAELADDDQDSANMYRTFTDQAIALIGSPTSDGRMLSKNIDMSYRSFPLPLMWCKQSGDGHDDAYTIGVIEDARMVGTNIVASGYLLNTPEADEASNENAHGVSNPSVDLAAAEWTYTDENGREIGEGELWDRMENGDPIIMTFTKAELIGTTLVSTPAFDTRLHLDDERSSREVAIVASVVREIKPATFGLELFADPKLLRPTLPTMNQETGRIYGHLAEWGHIIRGGVDAVPHNYNDYANFHTSQVMLDNGKQLSVGRLTVEGGHAPITSGVSVATARAHYDNACSAFALVRVGEDAHGIWFSGVPAPGVDPDIFQMGMTCPLSGDWRDCDGGLDMIAAHAVNSPGFPIYSGATGPDGREVALVASFGPSSRRTPPGGEVANLSREDITAILAEAFVQAGRRTKHAEMRDAALARARAVALSVPAPKSPREQIGELLAGRR